MNTKTHTTKKRTHLGKETGQRLRVGAEEDGGRVHGGRERQRMHADAAVARRRRVQQRGLEVARAACLGQGLFNLQGGGEFERQNRESFTPNRTLI